MSTAILSMVTGFILSSSLGGQAGSSQVGDRRVAVADMIWKKSVNAEIVEAAKCKREGGAMFGQFGFGLRIRISNKSDQEIDLADLPRVGIQLKPRKPGGTGPLWLGVDVFNFASNGKCYVPDPKTGDRSIFDSSHEALFYLLYDRRANYASPTVNRGGQSKAFAPFKFRRPVKGEAVIPAGREGIVMFFVDTFPEMGPDGDYSSFFWIHPAMSTNELPPPGVDWDKRLEISYKGK